MGDFDFDLKEAEQFIEELNRFSKKALPFAARNALNTTAFEARKLWKGEMEKSFTLRNTFTTRSIRVEKARISQNIGQMQAFIGSPLDYLEKQESGGTGRGRTGGSKPIPTKAAAGEGKGTGARTRPVRRPNRLASIRLGKRARFGSRKQRNAIAINRAVRGNKFAVIETRRGDAIMKVTGRKRVKLRMMWDLFNRSVQVPRNPTLQRTLEVMEKRMPRIYLDSVAQQVARQRLFR